MKPVSDLASSEYYYRHFNSGWEGDNDMLTQALNAKGYEIANGQPLSYDWLCAGWLREDCGPERGLVDISRYTGFLKCLYTLGMIGGNAGYYAYPEGGFGASFPPNQPPHWLRQMVALSRVHALFSHLEPFLREGDLLPGPRRHIWSNDQPAYEFPTSEIGTRVVVRKLRAKPKWLITAWAADGRDRPVQVTIPELGEVTIMATAVGTVHTAVWHEGRAILEVHIEATVRRE